MSSRRAAAGVTGAAAPAERSCYKSSIMAYRVSLTILLSSALCAWGCGGDGASAADAGEQDASSLPDARSGLQDAITGDALAPADARPPALDCLGSSLSETAPNPLTIAGTAINPGIPGVTPDTPLVGANLQLFTRGTDTSPLATTTTTDGGQFTLSVANSSQTPIDAYLKSTAASYWTTYSYPAVPLSSNQSDLRVRLTTLTQFELLASYASVTPDPGKGLITVVVLDCAGTPIAGATVIATPSTDEIIYMDSRGTPSDAATSTAADGLALLFNVPTGLVELRASVDGQNLRSHILSVIATNHDGDSGDEAVFATVLQP